MLIDTHCHLNIMLRGYQTKSHVEPFSATEKQKIKKYITSAQEAGVQKIINVGTDAIESKTCLALAQEYSACYAAVGLHPNDARQDWVTELVSIEHLLQEPKVVAIGECGIDKHYDEYDVDIQTEVFRKQIELALMYDKPLIIHSRDAADKTLEILDEYKKEKLRGVIHCFTYTSDYAQEFCNRSFYIGIGGVATYPKNEYLRNAISTVGFENIILETDAPFLTPQPKRGKKNEPAYLAYTAQYLADFFEKEYTSLVAQTTKNANRLFNLQG